jgi:uncharacterized membrane protein
MKTKKIMALVLLVWILTAVILPIIIMVISPALTKGSIYETNQQQLSHHQYFRTTNFDHSDAIQIKGEKELVAVRCHCLFSVLDEGKI